MTVNIYLEYKWKFYEERMKPGTPITINKDTKLYLWFIGFKFSDWWNSGYFRVYPQPAMFHSATWWPPSSRNKALLRWWTEATKTVCLYCTLFWLFSTNRIHNKLALFHSLFLNDFISGCLYTCTQIASVLLWFREVLTVTRNWQLKTLHQKQCERL